MPHCQELGRLGHDLDWNLLRTFMVIVQEGSITGAAARLFLTQPAVSLALKRLEDRLGRPLIERGGGRFRITSAGEAIYREVVDMFGTISRFGSLVAETPDEISGHVHILLASRIEAPVLDRSLRLFHARHPRVSFRIDVMPSAQVHLALQQKAGTLGVCLMREPIPGLASELLLHQRYHLYCGPTHRLFGRRDLDVSDLRQEDFVSFTSDQIDGALWPLALYRAREGFAGRIVGASSNLDEVRRMIVCGLGIGSLPAHITGTDIETGLLWGLPPEGGVSAVDLHLLWNPQARLNPAEQAFLDLLLAGARSLPPEERVPEMLLPPAEDEAIPPPRIARQ